MNTTVQNHLDAKRLQPDGADDQEVAGFWSKALTAFEDAVNPSSSLENRLLRAYDAGRIAASALVREAGYRTRGGEGHHYVTFDVARSLVADADLRRALDEMNSMRKVRHTVEYEADDNVEESMVERARRLAEQIIGLGGRHLRERRPHMALPARG